MFRRKTICVLLLIFAAGITWLFRYPILTRIWPGLLVKRAAVRTLEEMQIRFEEDPLEILRRTLDFEDHTRILCDLSYQSPSLGATLWNLDILLQKSTPQMLADGSVQHAGKSHPFGLYLNEEFAALRTSQSPDTVWYGITYDHFSDVFRDNPVFKILLKNYPLTLFQWLDNEEKIPALPQISIPELKLEPVIEAASVLAFLPWEVSVQKEQVEGREEPVYLFHSELPGETILAMIAKLPRTNTVAWSELQNYLSEKPDAQISGEFILRGAHELLGFSLSFRAEGEEVIFSADCSEGAGFGPVELQLQYHPGQTISLEIMKRQRNQEQGKLILPSGGEWTIRWIPEDAQLQITQAADSSEAGIVAKFNGSSRSFQIQAPDTAFLIEAISGREVVHPDRFGAGSFTILPGDPFSAPAHRDFRIWSTEELFALLEALHSLDYFS